MSIPLKFSEAFAIGLHATTIIAANGDAKSSVANIADELNCSLAHLQKVLQRLVKSGILRSIRGPKGGFLLSKKADTVYVLDIYESIEGQLILNNCLFESRVCTRALCVLGSLTTNINHQVSDYFKNTLLSDIVCSK